MSNPLFPVRPTLATKEIDGIYERRNFEELRDYFENQNQLLDFIHLEVNFSAAVTNSRIKHTLGYIPKDIIVTKIVGTGRLTWNYSKFSNEELDVTTDGPVRIRFYVGTYFKDTVSLEDDDLSDTQTVEATPG